MSQKGSCCAAEDDQGFGPDCLRCMRIKLRATCVVVFFRTNDGWRLSSYQGDKPSSDAEIEFYCMLRAGLPEQVAAEEKGFILVDDQSVAAKLPEFKEMLEGYSVIAAAVRKDDYVGVRLAWRENSDPFTESELAVIQCVGDCPEGCGPS